MLYSVDVTHKDKRKGCVYVLAKDKKHVRFILRDTPFRIRNIDRLAVSEILKKMANGAFVYCEVSEGSRTFCQHINLSELAHNLNTKTFLHI